MIDYSEDCLFQTLFLLNGSVAPRACLYAVPTCLLAVIFALGDTWFWPSFREDLGILEANKSQLWVASFGVLFPVLVFRTNRAMSRFWEGTGLLHQMRGEWFDSMSCCVSFSRAGMASKPEETSIFRHTIVRLMSLCHGSALKEIGGADAEDIETIDPFGLDTKTLQHLKDCSEVYNFNRVEVLLHMLQLVITRGLEDGIMPVPPPILSRVYQTLSRGFVNQLNAKKIADTRFPFPFSQLIALMLFVNCFTIPIMVCCLFESPLMCAIFSFLPVFGMAAMNFIGVELENPFGQDANDLPLDHFQAEMNNCLLMLLHTNADMLPASDLRRCLVDTEAIRQSARRVHSHEKVLGNKFGNGKQKGHLYAPSKDNGEECSASRLHGTEQPDRERASARSHDRGRSLGSGEGKGATQTEASKRSCRGETCKASWEGANSRQSWHRCSASISWEDQGYSPDAIERSGAEHSGYL